MVFSEEQQTLSFPTDTSQPFTPILIFYLHSGAHPFCSHPGCLCMQNNEQLETLLRGVVGRELKLREVVNGAIRWEAPMAIKQQDPPQILPASDVSLTYC